MHLPRPSALSVLSVPFVLFLFSASAFAAVADPAAVEAARKLYTGKKYPDAQKAFEAIVAADPKCAEAHYFISRLALQRGDQEASLPPAEKSVALAPDNAEYQHNLGDSAGSCAQKASIFRQPGLAKKCLAAYERAVALKPDNIDYHQSALEFYRQAPGFMGGGMDKATATATTMVKLDPLRGHGAFVTLYVADKKFDQALPHAAEVKKLDAAQGRLAFVSIYFESKKYDQAFAQFDEVLTTTPDDYNSLYQVGKLAAISGQYLDRGATSLRRCLELTPPATSGTPGHPAAHWRLGQILELKKDLAGAKAAFEAALKADPNFAPAAEALKKLK